MIVPGSQGIRLHLYDCLSAGEEALKTRIADAMQEKGSAQLVSFECPTSLNAQLDFSLSPVVHIISQSKLEDLARERDKGGALGPIQGPIAKVIPQFSTTLCTKRNSSDSNHKEVVSLIKQSVDLGFAPRAIIKSAWKSSVSQGEEIDEEDDTNLHHHLLSSACVDIADAGSAVIVFSDDLHQATSESVRSACEEAFGMDVVGETMMERLSLRLAKKLHRVRAKELGVTRFDLKDSSDLM
jgi:hypothetical protein